MSKVAPPDRDFSIDLEETGIGQWNNEDYFIDIVRGDGESMDVDLSEEDMRVLRDAIQIALDK